MINEKVKVVRCPKCGAEASSASDFCQTCGNDLREASAVLQPISDGSFSALGDLDEGESCRGKKQDEGTTHTTDSGFFSSLGNLEEDELASDGEKNDVGKGSIVEPFKQKKLYCTECGSLISANSMFCKRCGKRLSASNVHNKFSWKKWMTVAVCCAVLLGSIILLSSGSSTKSGQEDSGRVEKIPVTEESYAISLSDECDYVLCQGTDTAGNTYELVANQTESAMGYEITVGVIKNNQWLYPLSKEFPFLAEDNLFYVSGSMSGESGTSLSNPNVVIQSIYFVDTGAFLIDCYKAAEEWFNDNDHYKVIFSCSTLESYTVDSGEWTMKYHKQDSIFVNGRIKFYGQISTDNGNVIMYTETSGTRSGWLEDQVFDWCVLNMQTLSMDTIASGVEGVRPQGILSDNLFFASDHCFYNRSGQKAIDLSQYKIPSDGDIYFENGICEFTAKNSIGTEFLIAIDKQGNVLSEIEK